MEPWKIIQGQGQGQEMTGNERTGKDRKEKRNPGDYSFLIQTLQLQESVVFSVVILTHAPNC